MTRELRLLGLRPECPVCERGGQRVTIELVHEPGEELQLDWLELAETPWGEPVYVLVGALSYSGRIRAMVSDGLDCAHLVSALDGVLRRLGGTARSWRTDRMATVVEPGSDRLRPEAAELAKHYAVTILVCPPRRAQRKGVVEASIRYLGRSWWRTARVARPADAQRSLDEWCVAVADQRRRGPLTIAQKAAAEPLLPLSATAYPAGGASRRARGRLERAGQLRGQPLQRPAHPGRADGDGTCPGRRAGRADRVRRRRAGREPPAGAGRCRAARPVADGSGGAGAGAARRIHDPAPLRAQTEPAADSGGARPRGARQR